MGRQLVLVMFLAVLGGPACAERMALPAELWEQPRSGDAILAQPELKRSATALLDHPDARLSIHYGKGDEALLQAEELRAWLVALAMDGERIDLIADGDAGEGLNLELTGITVEEKPADSKGTP